MINAGILFTGGKDSVFALHRVIKEGVDVKVLLSVIPHYKYSMLYHQPNYAGLVSQAQSLEIPLETIGLLDPAEEEEALKKLLIRVKKNYGIDVIVTGGIKSKYQQRIFSKIAESLNLKLHSPSWGLDEKEYMLSVLNEGIKFILISITSMGIPHYLLGKVFDYNDLNKLINISEKYKFNLSFEGGEAETFVIDAPLFKYRLGVKGKAVVLSEFEGYFEFEKVVLFKKH